ncbi:MAG: hypothetical protein ACTSQB_02010 [Candidatus Heimdallarchaeota archaeon]
MNSIEKSSRRQRFLQNLKAFFQAFGIGIVQGVIASLIGILLMLINGYAIFGVLVIWLIFGWVSSYIIKLRALEITTILLSSALCSGLVYYLSNLEWWFIFLILGISLFFWSISFITKIMIYPPKKITADTQKEPIKKENET